MEQTLYLVLENGKIFKGKSFGAVGEAVGEVVFTTGMTGYLETLTDRSYYGQIVVQTFPLIGNAGVIPPDFESAGPAIQAYIVRQWCREPSNFRSEGCLDTFLKENNIIGLYDIDTRALTKIIREAGVMNGMITTDPDNVDVWKLKSYRIEHAVDAVTCKEKKEYPSKGRCKVTLLDFGAKENIIRCLNERGCDVTSYPAGTPAEELLADKPDGIMLSNGPGDPQENTAVIREIKKLIASQVPMFGICLGHQLLALANGGKTVKLKYGHRGGNQPVKDSVTGRVYITCQNHGYCVDSETLDEGIAKVRFANANDGTCEGVDYLNAPNFSVQFHPEAASGPKDTEFLFDRFIELMEVKKNAKK